MEPSLAHPTRKEKGHVSSDYRRNGTRGSVSRGIPDATPGPAVQRVLSGFGSETTPQCCRMALVVIGSSGLSHRPCGMPV